MARISRRSIILTAAFILTAGTAYVAGAASAGPGEKALAEVSR